MIVKYGHTLCISQIKPCVHMYTHVCDLLCKYSLLYETSHSTKEPFCIAQPCKNAKAFHCCFWKGALFLSTLLGEEGQMKETF